jgi:homoserine O-succinyltransferase
MSNAPYESAPGCVRIALVNNMPDPALEDTEMQFMELLDAASGDVPVRISLYSLPAVPRGERAQEHLNSFYFSIDSLWNKSFDAVIVTGTEPRHSDLRQEPYWRSLTTVFDWAERNTVSTVLSCLAAHASVLHSDGIQRQPLKDKKFGVFQAESILDHELTRRATRPLSFPHSRWNEAPEHALIACGYSILTRSAQAGPDLFVKQKRKSLFVHFQGHPEYGAQTLLKEYRRDIKRFLRYERETYPAMPHGYFGSVTAAPLAEFQKGAFANRGEEQMALFPETALAASLRNTWWPGAISIYRNWLRYVSSRKSANGAFAAMAQDIRGSAVAPGNERV